LFERRTFAEMQRNGRPLILINATDMTSGSEFEFDEPQFNLICSDLARFSVGRAVAASSAFPIILTPVRLRNYAGSCDYQLPNWVAIALRHPDITSRRYHDALAVRSFLDARRRPYIHLMDGGIADNLGLRGLISDISGRRGSDNVLYRMGFGHAKRVVFIVVNAEAGADPRWDLTESAPTLRQMFRAVSTAQVSRNNLETIEMLRQSLFKWASRVRTARIGKKGGAGYYVVEVGFDALADEKERAFFKNLPTRFHLSGQAVKKVEAAGQRLLAESPEYRVLLRDLAAPPNHRLKID
jgi:NTE family protein